MLNYQIRKKLYKLLLYLSITCMVTTVSANSLIIDDRSSGDLSSNLGEDWRLLTDNVMGGISSGTLELSLYKGKQCLRMQGDVSTDNNGGFVQMALSLDVSNTFDASVYSGIELDIAGNNDAYNLHYRTSGLRFPWQSYRATFFATDNWQTIRLAFADVAAYKTGQTFMPDKLKRIGLVAIGRDFQADLCLASVKFYVD